MKIYAFFTIISFVFICSASAESYSEGSCVGGNDTCGTGVVTYISTKSFFVCGTDGGSPSIPDDAGLDSTCSYYTEYEWTSDPTWRPTYQQYCGSYNQYTYFLTPTTCIPESSRPELCPDMSIEDPMADDPLIAQIGHLCSDPTATYAYYADGYDPSVWNGIPTGMYLNEHDGNTPAKPLEDIEPGEEGTPIYPDAIGDIPWHPNGDDGPFIYDPNNPHHDDPPIEDGQPPSPPDDPSNDQHHCPQCLPGGYIYTNGTCTCVDDNTSNPTPHPDPAPDNTPDTEPSTETPTPDPDDDGQGNDQTDKWLKAIKGDTGVLVSQGTHLSGQIGDLIRKVIDGNQLLYDIDGKMSGIGDDIGDIKDMMKDGLEADIGNPGDLPEAEYVGDDLEEVEEIDPLAEQFADYIQDGIPGLSVIKNFSATASGSSSIDVSIYGDSISIDFAEWKTILNLIGTLLLAISGFISFRIITA